MSLTDLFAPVYSCEGISKFKLEEKAVKVLQKFIEQLDTYLSLSAAKRNFKSITSQDMFVIVSELERIGYLIGKIDKGRMVFKFNNTAERSQISVPLSDIEYAQKRYEERIMKKVERAAKTIKRYKNLSSLTELQVKKESMSKEDFDLLPKINPTYEATEILKLSKSLTAKELHDQGICGRIIGENGQLPCKICLFEQGLGF